MTLNPKLGERAVLIKNYDGDWGIVCGHWTGIRKGVPPSRGENVLSAIICFMVILI